MDVNGTLETDALTIGGAAVLAAATTSAVGAVELATIAETTTGTDTARAVTPDGLKDGYQGSSNVTTLGTIATGVFSSFIRFSTYGMGPFPPVSISPWHPVLSAGIWRSGRSHLVITILSVYFP